ncbi:CAP domain-containing protein [Xylariales sp. PMI_506]|nr:CAP domain-containing protein [Xylariales sp. PMI_506]
MSSTNGTQQQEQPQAPTHPTPPVHTEEDAATTHQAVKEHEGGPQVHLLAATVHANLSADQAAALKLHNDGRASKGLHPLVWDNTLAQHAESWAQHLVQIDQMVHSTGAQRPGEGENLAWAWASNGVKNPLTGGAQGWMNEAKDYHGETIAQGDFSKYGHYTQCMWKSTTKVGLASAKTSKGAVYTVGRYAAAGNWVGQKPY